MMQIGYVRESVESGDTFVILEFDAVMSEMHEVTATLTDHPVERGADLSDHKRPGQRRLRLEGIVSNTPIGAIPLSGENSSADRVTGQVQSLGDHKAVTLQFSDAFDRVRDMLEALTALCEGAQLLTVTTDVRTYEDVELVGVGAPRSVEMGDSIAFTLDFTRVRIAETRQVGDPAPRQPRGRRTRDNGAQTGTDDNATAAGTTNNSALRNMADSETGQSLQAAWGISL